MKIKSDNKFDQELQKYKVSMDRLLLESQKFMAIHSTLPPKDKALALKSIQRTMYEIAAFLSKPHGAEATSGSQKFLLDNIRNSYSSLASRWHKFERSLG